MMMKRWLAGLAVRESHPRTARCEIGRLRRAYIRQESCLETRGVTPGENRSRE